MISTILIVITADAWGPTTRLGTNVPASPLALIDVSTARSGAAAADVPASASTKPTIGMSLEIGDDCAMTPSVTPLTIVPVPAADVTSGSARLGLDARGPGLPLLLLGAVSSGTSPTISDELSGDASLPSTGRRFTSPSGRRTTSTMARVSIHCHH